MSRTLGTVARGVRTPIFREGDNVVEGVVSSVLTALKENGIQPHDKDVAAVTESVVARCQGNYATCEQIAEDVRAKTGGKTVGVAFPILSRNRFSLLLSGIAAGVEKVVLMLSYPSDEVGNHLVSLDQLDEAGIDPWHDVLDLEQFRAAFGKVIHPFTGVDYVDFYKGIIEDAGAQAEIVFANRVQTVLDYTDTVICCDIHTRQRSKRLLKKAGARVVLGLDDLLTAPVNGSGYNPQYGLLGSNKADDTRVKLFPRDADVVAEAIGQRLSVKPVDSEAAVERLEGELTSLKLRCTQLEESVFESIAKEQAGKGNVLLFQPAMRPDSVRRLMDAVSKTCGGLAAVFAGEEGHYAYALGRADGQDISPLVKAMNTVLHGRGGGRNGFAQGSVETERSAIESFFKENGYGICN